jgi:hypothetical protein
MPALGDPIWRGVPVTPRFSLATRVAKKNKNILTLGSESCLLVALKCFKYDANRAKSNS